MTTTVTSLPAIVDKFNALHDAVAGELVERETHIHAAILALASGTHLFFLGSPGIAKSHLFNRMMARISGFNYFPLLFGSFTGPEDVFGPLDVAGLEHGHYRRLTTGYLPWAHVAFTDEIWKANDSILNSMLEAFNERKFKNDGIKHDIPLSTVFAASNELPENESLAAIYDRMPQRFELQPIQEDESFIRMLRLDIPDEADLEPILTWDEIELVKAHIRTIPVEPAVDTAMAEIRRELRKKNIEPSDRRFKHAIRLLQGEAFLDGSPSVDLEHLAVLVNVLWDSPEQAPDVQKVVLDKANPLQREIMELIVEITKVGDLVTKAIDAQDEEERQSIGMEAHPKVKQAAKDLKALTTKAAGSRRNAGLLSEAKEKLHGHSKRLIEHVFDYEANSDFNLGA